MPRMINGQAGTDAPDGYEFLGKFEPRDAEHILKQLEEERIPFQIDAPEEARPSAYRRSDWIFIFVRREHMNRAGAIVDENSRN
jgi:hypothetical protein